MDGVILQCTRVDVWPNRTGAANLPTVNDGSVTAACCICRKQVWLSKAARAIASTTIGIKPVCDDCYPAKRVGPPVIEHR